MLQTDMLPGWPLHLESIQYLRRRGLSASSFLVAEGHHACPQGRLLPPAADPAAAMLSH